MYNLKRKPSLIKLTPIATALLIFNTPLYAAPAGEHNNLSPRLTQDQITSGVLTLNDIRRHGRRIFGTPFNKHDGYGDGPVDDNIIYDPTSLGSRPTLSGNGTWLRINGLDAQTCVECHSVRSTSSIPYDFAIGGIGTINNSALGGPRHIDVDDDAGLGIAYFDGRMINPPFIFGAGGIELISKEMTMDLQAIKQTAINNPDRAYTLESKGISFGSIIYISESNTLDTSNVRGVASDLVVRPFGRKGEFSTTRQFDLGALQFHLGIQPTEVVGDGDADHDGVSNEITAGEVSALAIYNTTLTAPTTDSQDTSARMGAKHFKTNGCSSCHTPSLDSRSAVLTYSFPEIETDPTANVYYSVDLDTLGIGFNSNADGGIRVPLYSDLRWHNMGDAMADNLNGTPDSTFITARLWGIADTAPYMHDGRALTLTEAINMHGGDAEEAAIAFSQLDSRQKIELLSFLRTLRTPLNPGSDIFNTTPTKTKTKGRN